MFRRFVPLLVAASFVLAATITAHASVVITLSPSGGIVNGKPGGTVGWGFTVSNDSASWLWITSSEFINTNRDSSWGTYTDLSFNSIPIAPAVVVGLTPTTLTVPLSLTVPYDPADPKTSTGAGSFLISSSTAYNDMVKGFIRFTYDIYAANPSNLDQTPVSSDSKDVIAGVTTVPEPATYVLLGLGLGGLTLLRRRQNRA